MRALRVARWSLLASLLLWAAGLALTASGLTRPDAALLVALVAVPAMVLSAAACVILQVAQLLRRPSRLTV